MNRPGYDKSKRLEWISNGLCSKCGRKIEDISAKRCNACKEKAKKQWNGMDLSTREDRLKKQRIRMQKKLKHVRENGICSSCYKNKCLTGKSSCQLCLLKNTERAKKRINSGICICCNKLSTNGRYCKECLEKKYINTKRKLRDSKIEALIYLGNKCSNCGILANKENYSIFDFHHVNKETKEYNMTKVLKMSPITEKVKLELNKCVILCANCHRIEHDTRGDIK